MHVFLAKASLNSIAMGHIGLVLLQLLFISFCFYLAAQALLNFPALKNFFEQEQGQILYQVLLFLFAVFLCYSLAKLRILHQLGVVSSPRKFLWPDILFSALAISRLSIFWHMLYRWLEKLAT